MINYRITKFDPKKRNQAGHFLDDSEWTAISDIGNPKYNSIRFEEYEKIETTYVDAIIWVLEEKGIKTLQIDSLERPHKLEYFENYKKNGRLKNLDVDFETEIATLTIGTSLNLKMIRKMIRLVLREIAWMKLFSATLTITFGYDYYMYVECSKLTRQTIKRIEQIGLFVELI